MYEKKLSLDDILIKEFGSVYNSYSIFTLNQDIECEKGIFRKDSRVFVIPRVGKENVVVAINDGYGTSDTFTAEKSEQTSAFLSKMFTKDEQASKEYEHSFDAKRMKSVFNYHRFETATFLSKCTAVLIGFFLWAMALGKENTGVPLNIWIYLLTAFGLVLTVCLMTAAVCWHKSEKYQKAFDDTKERVMKKER